MDPAVVIEATRRWVAEIVIGLNLCPFARRVFDADRIRFVVSDATDPNALRADLARELTALAAAARPVVETTILIHPNVLGDFLDYNDFVGEAEGLIDEMGLTGTIQVASFHPDYRFAGTAPGAVENYTNRSPYPMLHLLREESITEVAGDPDALAGIPERNIETLRRLGKRAALDRLKAIRDGRPLGS